MIAFVPSALCRPTLLGKNPMQEKNCLPARETTHLGQPQPRVGRAVAADPVVVWFARKPDETHYPLNSDFFLNTPTV